MVPVYVEKFCPNPDEVFKELLDLNWLALRKARREYFMAHVPRSYTYGGDEHAMTYQSEPFSPAVQGVLDQLNASASYDLCFLNRYDGQHNMLGWHADDSPSMDHEHPIAVVSFGAEREIWWRFGKTPGTVPPEHRQKLAHGSLFVMPAGFQREHEHRIPKSDRDCGVRISLTFRRYVAPTT